MRPLLFVSLITFLLSCSKERYESGLARYSYEEVSKADSICMTASDGMFQFYHINEDTVVNTILRANRKFFGDEYDTEAARDSIRHWLVNDFFSTKTYTQSPWTLSYPADETKFTCNYHAYYGIEDVGKNVFDLGDKLSYENRVCLKKLISHEGVYDYVEKKGIAYNLPKNRLKFLCDFNIDIRRTPVSLFNNSETEYYRVTIRDTVDMFTVMHDSIYSHL